MGLDVRAGRVGQVVSAAAGRAPRERYLPIAEHGLIGDLHTVALVMTVFRPTSPSLLTP
jgi:hypothetical protein